MNVEIGQRLIPLIGELALVVGTLTQQSVDVAATEAAPAERQWYATLVDASDPSQAYGLAIDHDGAALLGRLVSGGAGGVEEASIGDLLRNALTQAVAALGVRQPPDRLELRLETLEPRLAAAGWDSGFSAYALTMPGLAAPLVIAVAGVPGRMLADERLGGRIDVILDIDLPVVVRFGRTEMPIRALSRLGPGSVIDLGRSPDDPVEVLVSNRIVARGEVVIVGGNYGVRILDVASQSERARSMEA